MLQGRTALKAKTEKANQNIPQLDSAPHNATAQLADHRNDSVAIRQLQRIANAAYFPSTIQKKADQVALQRKLTNFAVPAQLQGAEEEELMQGKFDSLQRAPEEEELVQGMFKTLQRAPEEEELMQGQFKPNGADSSKVTQRQGNNTGLPDNLKSGMESLSGQSLNHVKVHYNSSKPAAVQAHAYAQGSDIHLASGQEKHLPHELGHVVQQMEGRVQPTTSVGGMQVNDNEGLETEATKMGDSALQKMSDKETTK